MILVRNFLLFATIAGLAACSEPDSGSAGSAPDVINDEAPSATEMPAVIESTEIEPGLSMRILGEGSGAVAEVGHTAVVHYTGWLYNPSAPDNRGNKFDSSLDRDQHFPFPLGGGRVIPGWDRGVVGMRVGEKRELTIAPELAYRDRDLGIIPPGSTLVFEVDLVELLIPETATQ